MFLFRDLLQVGHHSYIYWASDIAAPSHADWGSMLTSAMQSRHLVHLPCNTYFFVEGGDRRYAEPAGVVQVFFLFFQVARDADVFLLHGVYLLRFLHSTSLIIPITQCLFLTDMPCEFLHQEFRSRWASEGKQEGRERLLYVKLRHLFYP